MVDRVIAYDGALPQTTDILNTNKFGLVSESYQNRALIGTNTQVAGLACTPTSPTADLHVTVGVGTIYQTDNTDAAAYGDLGTDNTSIQKQGILAAPVTLTITPPGSGGFSQVYLVQAILNDIDAGAAVLSYYNSANPLLPFSGPNNSGASQFTTRTCVAAIALKAGVPATTGTQVTPNPDLGFVGLYAITVANGQTQITGGNIVQALTAPFFPTLPQVPPAVQNGTWVYAVDNGALNHLAIQPSPNVTALVAGMGFRVKVLVSNTLASDIVINFINSSGVASQLGPVVIHRGSGAGVVAGDLVSGSIVDLVYDGTFFQMANYLGSGTNTNTNTTTGIPYIADSGAANALVGTYSPAITSGQQVAGLTLAIKLANTITGSCTINVSGLGLKNVTLGDLNTPPFGAFVAGEVLVLEYDGTQYQIVNTSIGMFYRPPPPSFTIFVNTAIGNDSTLDGTQSTVSGTRGPFKTIQRGINQAWTFAPGPNLVTISIAAGTYNENPATPGWPAPNITINGAGAGSTIVQSTSSGTNAFTIAGPQNITLQNLQLAGSANSGLVTENGAFCVVTNVGFNNTTTLGQHCWAITGSEIFISSGVTIGGNCNAVFNGEQSGTISFGQVSITLSNGIGVTSGFCFASLNGTVSTGSATTAPSFVNPGFASGPKYLAIGNGVVYALAQGFNFFPGNVGGSTSSGGQYIP